MESDNDALFSLELVVEKIYIPHLTCRFPSVAFRLLDFPTIVIKHVEDDLGAVIRQKVSLESSHHIPQQFHELKDRHGNFMVKKGKSCLFTMSPNLLKQHLVSTPLYVMVIDQFPNVPKLLGNATVPLDSLINLVLADIARLGPTVPSVHGDKGLYKLCNLMGKEIGYAVLGFRLLCLGPSLIPHLPQQALAQMSSQKMAFVEDKKIEQVLTQSKFVEVTKEREKDIDVRDSFSMTEPMKQDVLLQTVELDEKGVNVNTLTENDLAPHQASPLPMTNAVSTQTEKRKLIKESQDVNKKWVERNDMKMDDDGIIVNNIVCPPPLFYNSEGAPDIYIERVSSSKIDEFEDVSIEDLSDIDSFDGYGLHKKVLKEDIQTKSHADSEFQAQRGNKQEDEMLESHQRSSKYIPQARQGEKIKGLPIAPQKETVFPLLSALINELACIQDPQFLLDVSRKLQLAEQKVSRLEIANEKSRIEQKEKVNAPSVVAAVASALSKKMDTSRGNLKEVESKNERNLENKEQRKNVKEKLTPKERAENAKRKSKLVYGLTNTQRLRLQKVNPAWLKSVEKDAVMKSRKDRKVAVDEFEMNATNFSDTLTEVRRLAEKELDSTAGGDTLRHLASEVEEFESTLEHTNKNRFPVQKSFTSPKRTHVIRPEVSQKSPISARQVNKMGADHKKRSNVSRSSARSPAHRSTVSETSSKSRHRIHQRRAQQRKDKLDDSSDPDELMIKKKPVPLERHMFGITSPSLDDQGQKINDYDDVLSARSDLPSSRSRSIEVHLPSADPDMDDNATLSDDGHRVVDDNDSDDDIPLPDDSIQTEPKVMELNFPRYVSREMSLPDSIIEGNPNASLNISGDITQNSPMESTRHSRNMTEEPNGSRALQSTDYDTRQFHSTDEPELQGLMSEEENQSGTAHSGAQSYLSVQTSQKFPVINPQLSENSPVPSVRRSTTKLDAGALSYLPSMSLSKGQMSPTSSRPSTPKASPSTPKVTNYRKAIDLEPIHKNARGNITPRSGTSSPKRQTPRSRRQFIDYKTSIHTDSVSSYMPSDPENLLVSLSSNSGNYSDDFQPLASGESGDGNSSVEQLPKIIPSRKLGYTIT